MRHVLTGPPAPGTRPTPAAPRSFATARRRPAPPAVQGPDGRPDDALGRLVGLLAESESLLQQLDRCDWRIAQARAYLARPGAGNLSLAAFRLADLRRRRDGLLDRLAQAEIEAREIVDIP